MEAFVAALVQHASPVGQREENLARTVRLVREAAGAGARLVVLPELGITGHAGHPAMVLEAEPVPGGAAYTTLAALAAEIGVYISAGIAEDDRGIHYNTQFLVGPEGPIGKQRKYPPLPRRVLLLSRRHAPAGAGDTPGPHRHDDLL